MYAKKMMLKREFHNPNLGTQAYAMKTLMPAASNYKNYITWHGTVGDYVTWHVTADNFYMAWRSW
jgi:hypothetical protein